MIISMLLKILNVKIPAIDNRDDTGFPLCNFHESGFGHVKVDPGWVAPSSGIGILRPVWWANVGGRNSSEL